MSADAFDWVKFKANAAAWLSDSRAALPADPTSIRVRLHLARALLAAETFGLPFGYVDWTHPGAQRIQLAQLEWDSLSEAERVEGDRAFRQGHGLCEIDLSRCSMLRVIGHLNSRGRR